MTVYDTVFGNSTVTPASNRYQEITLSADKTLSWPSEGGDGPFATETIDVDPTVAGHSVTLPDATLASNGEGSVFNNVGSNSFTVLDAGGNLVATVNTSQSFFVYLTDNTSTNGTWRSVQFGTGASSAQASALAGSGLTASGGKLLQSMPPVTKSSDYTLGQSDQAKAIIWTGGSGTITIPTVSGLTGDWFVGIKNGGTGTLTLSPTGSDIDGGSSVTLSTNDACFLFTDGSDVFTFGKGQAAEFAFSYISIDISGTGDYTLSSSQVNQISYEFTGTLTGNRSIIVPDTVQQYWVRNSTSGSYTLTVKTSAGSGATVTQGGSSILFCNGTDVQSATDIAAPSAIPVPITEGGTGATSASAARTALGATSVGNAVFTATDAAAARTTLGAPSVSDAIAYGIAL